MVENYVKKNKLNVNIENFFNRKAPSLQGLKVELLLATGMSKQTSIEKSKS